jgi:hypothetical protein
MQVVASPSAAGAVIVGRSENGLTIWKVQRTGMPYGNWQNQGVEEAAPVTAQE